jgi:hypothetical protein
MAGCKMQLRSLTLAYPLSGSWLFVLWIVGIFILVIIAALMRRRRDRLMNALGEKLGLKKRGGELPLELSLAGTALENAGEFRHVMEGKPNGVPVMVFECRVGRGKASWERTVIAARGGRDVFASVPSDTSYTAERAGEWMILYAPRGLAFRSSGLMPIAELEARLTSIGGR